MAGRRLSKLDVFTAGSGEGSDWVLATRKCEDIFWNRIVKVPPH